MTIDELDAEIHFPKEGVVLSRDSRSSEKFMHGIKVLMTNNNIDNLSEEARKGQQEKAEQGIWPTKTPLGYLNVTGPDGRKVIAVDPEVAPIVSKLFEWYATGEFALKEVAKKAELPILSIRRAAHRFPPAPCIRSCAIAFIPAGSSGTASSIRASMSRWSRSRHGSGCRA